MAERHDNNQDDSKHPENAGMSGIDSRHRFTNFPGG